MALTDAPSVIHDFGAWSPDGARIAFAANSRSEADFDIFVQDVGSGERQCVYQGTHIVTVAGWRADGARLAALADRGYADMSLFVIDPETRQAQTIQVPPCNWQMVRWSGDGRTLLALTDQASNHLRLCRVDPDSGQPSVVFEAPGRDVEGWAISPDMTLLATVENDRGWSVLRVGPMNGERPTLDLPLGVISDPTFSPDGLRLAFTLSAPNRPSGIWLWERGKAARPLFCPDPAEAGIPSNSLAAFELVGWDSFDGKQIPGWLALPRGPAPVGGYPSVIWVHGGPVGQARPNFRPDMQMLVAQGFAVLMPNVRGSSGYGRAWCQSDDLGKRLDSVADLAAGARWLRAHPAIDPARNRDHGPVVRWVHGTCRRSPNIRSCGRPPSITMASLTSTHCWRAPAPGGVATAALNTGTPNAIPSCSTVSLRSIRLIGSLRRYWYCTEHATRACQSAKASSS